MSYKYAKHNGLDAENYGPKTLNTQHLQMLRELLTAIASSGGSMDLYARYKKVSHWHEKIIFFFVIFCSLSSAYADDNFSVSGKKIIATIDGQTAICALDAPASYAVESWDGGAVIVSTRGYIAISDLMSCKKDKLLHVSEIPQKVGFLTDINLSKGLYVSLDFISVSPFTYLATVAKIGSAANIVNLKGAYVAGKSIAELRQGAFTSSGDAGSSAISPDGRFVSPNGEIDCSSDGYPGVWDVLSDKRVFVDSSACKKLFQ